MIHPAITVALGGAAGSVLRYAVSVLIGGHAASSYPWATSAVNIAGCLLIGFISELAAAGQAVSADTRLFLTVGFCGGFTTFSTFCNENIALLRDGRILTAAVYIVSSVLAGLLAVCAGMWLARRM